MGQNLDPRETVSFDEALRMVMIINQVLIDMLVAKVIIIHEELHSKILEIKQKQGIVLSGVS
jgi:hypothetical protein